MSSAVAAAGVFTLAVLAPFEATSPLARLPWQSVSNLEAALLAAIACWGAALAWTRRLPPSGTPLLLPWAALAAALAIASAAAPIERANAWHMTGRVAAAATVYLLAYDGITTGRRLRIALALCVASGIAVALLGTLEYFEVDVVLRGLRVFRPAVSTVGDQIRAGGPLQYPTIASMYLEVTFAIGLGLLLRAIDAADGTHRAVAACWFVGLMAIGEGIAVTFTRAGLVTMAASVIIVGFSTIRRVGVERGRAALATLAALTAAIAILLVASRSVQSLWLRATTEGQDAWYRADVTAPETLTFSADRSQYVSISVANTGRVVWDSDGEQPFYLSYHWLDATGDRVVAYEGGRTRFGVPVRPGNRVQLYALVRAPRVAGDYRLEWDVVQEDRLWFSTEQGAPEATTSRVTVTGASGGDPLPTTARPQRSVRPGRLALWRAAARMFRAHPVLGVGPDNFRLLYGDYLQLRGADRRTHSNNMYLEILVGGGLVAGAALLWLLLSAVSLFVRSQAPEIDDVGNSVPGSLQVDLLAGWSQAPYKSPVGSGLAAAGAAIALHATVDSFLSFAPTYILFALTLGCAAAVSRGVETAGAHRV